MLKDKERQKYHARRHYEANKEKVKLRARLNSKIAAKRNKDYILNYLSYHPCVDCGNSNVLVLEFDHIKGEKKFNISNMKLSSYSIKTIQKEIEKCEVRCANCHRIITHKRRVDSKRIELL